MAAEQEPMSMPEVIQKTEPEVVPTPSRHIVRKAGIGATAIAAAATGIGGLMSPAPTEASAGRQLIAASDSDWGTNEANICDVYEVNSFVQSHPEIAKNRQPSANMPQSASTEGVSADAATTQAASIFQPIEFRVGSNNIRVTLDIAPCLPDEILTPEQIKAKFSIEAIKDKGYDPISKKEFMAIVKKNAPVILKYSKKFDYMDTEEEVIEELGGYVIHKVDISGPGVKDLGHFLSAGVIISLKQAKTLTGSMMDVAEAYLEIADAQRRLGQKYVRFEDKRGRKIKDPEKIDKMMDQMIQDAWDSGY